MTADRLVLLRHGRTSSNAAGRWQGQLDVPLDEVGVEQAERAGAALAALDPVRVLSSDLSRASATAAAVGRATGFEVTTDPVFREVDAGVWQGLCREEIVERWPDEFEAWATGDLDVPTGRGESRRASGARVAAGLRAAVDATPSGTLVVVGHGGSMRSAAAQLLEVVEGPWLGSLVNCRWALLTRARTGGWRLEGWNLSAPDPDPPAEHAEPAAPERAAL